MKKVTVITGHYGSGKTNVSVNLALALANEGKKVSVVDLDIVNPYFRTADFKDLFDEKGIELIASIYANTNLDIPAITFDIERLTKDDGYLIIDVGGDDDGAMALGRYKNIFDNLKLTNDIDMLYVINYYRFLTKDVSDTLELMQGIEYASRFKHTGIINNSNLGQETTVNTVKASFDYAKEVSKKANLPIVFTTSPEPFDCDEKIVVNKRFVKAIWE